MADFSLWGFTDPTFTKRCTKMNHSDVKHIFYHLPASPRLWGPCQGRGGWRIYRWPCGGWQSWLQLQRKLPRCRAEKETDTSSGASGFAPVTRKKQSVSGSEWGRERSKYQVVCSPCCHAAAFQLPRLCSTHTSQNRSSRTVFAPRLWEEPRCRTSQESKSFLSCQPETLWG